MTQKELHEILEYNENSGEFFWKKKLSNRVKIGDKAGYYGNRYVIISIKNRRYLAHYLVWLYKLGKFPSIEIDHKNQNSKDNRFLNLQEVSAHINSRNKPKRRDNTSGITGVSFDKFTNKWVVRIKDNNGVYKNRGRFDSVIEAKQERNRAINELGYSKLHGEQYSQLPYRKK